MLADQGECRCSAECAWQSRQLLVIEDHAEIPCWLSPCQKLTTKSLSDLKKRLSLFSAGAEHIRQLIKSFIKTNCFTTNFSFEEPEFCADDYVCLSCITLLTSYEKATKRLEELQGKVMSCLQSITPATVPPLLYIMCDSVYQLSLHQSVGTHCIPLLTSVLHNHSAWLTSN